MTSRVLLVMSMTLPPCGHISVLLVVRIGGTDLRSHLERVVDQTGAGRGDLDHAVVQVDLGAGDRQCAGAHLERNVRAADSELCPARVNELNDVVVFVDQDLMAGRRCQKTLRAAVWRRSLVARKPATAPDRPRNVASLELDPDAVAHFR